MEALQWILLVLIAFGTYFYLKLRRPPSFPPGPPVIPLLGSIPFLKYGGDKFHKEFDQLSKKYGSVFSLALGHTWIVVLNDYESIKEALVDKAKQFSGRIDDPRFDKLHPIPNVKGILDGDYSEEWVRQRHNALMLLRNFGWGKKGIAEKMSEERDLLLESLRDSNEKPFNPNFMINISVMNIILSMLLAERFDHNDSKMKSLIRHLDGIVSAGSQGSEWDYVPGIQSLIPGYSKAVEKVVTDGKALYDFISVEVEKREKIVNENQIDQPRDFIENYLLELKGVESGKARISQDWLKDICVDFFLAGSETTTTTLKWALLYMVHNLDVQTKIQEEIDEVIGKPTGRGMTSLSDREKLPYTDAAIMEMQRITSIVPMALIHKTTADVELRGYKIPKDTQVRYNIYSVLHDAKYWDEPYTLKPERFLENGKVTKNDKWVPFGMGRRMCLGEQLARQELFMFFTAIIHSFRIRIPDGVDLPCLEPAISGVILVPPQVEYIYEPRF